MKCKFFSLLIVLLVLTTAACLAESNTDTSDAADTARLFRMTPLFARMLMLYVSDVRIFLVDCVGQLKNTSQDLVSKIECVPYLSTWI